MKTVMEVKRNASWFALLLSLFLKIEINGEVPIKIICVIVIGPLITTRTGPNDV